VKYNYNFQHINEVSNLDIGHVRDIDQITTPNFKSPHHILQVFNDITY